MTQEYVLKKYPITCILLTFIIIIISLISGLLNKSNYQYAFLIPIIFSILFVFPTGIIRFFTLRPGIFLLYVISSIRFCIYPLMISFFGNEIKSGYQHYYFEYSNIATVLYVLEMVTIAITVYFYMKKKHKVKNKPINDVSIKWTVYITIILLIISFIIEPKSVNYFNFIFAFDASYESVELNSIVEIILDIGRYIISIYFMMFFYKRYMKTNRKYYYTAIWVFTILPLMLVTGLNRASVIIPATAILFVMIKLFPEKRKKIFLFFSMVIFVTVVFLIYAKSFSGSSDLNEVGIKTVSTYINSYYAGLDNMSTAVALKNYESSNNFYVMFIDLFYSIPKLGRVFLVTQKSSSMFNDILYSGLYDLRIDAIIPTVGQSILYFGYPFMWVMTMIFIYLGLKFDDRYSESTTIFESYVNAIAAVIVINYHCGSLSIIAQEFIHLIFPLWLIYLCGNKIQFIKRKYYLND